MSVHYLSEGLPGTDTPPARYIQPLPDRPATLHPPTLPLPTVDIALLLHPDHAAAETAKLDAALRSPGLFHAVNHGIPSTFLSHLLSTTREFLRAAANSPQSTDLEGYGADAVVGEDQVLDWSNRLYLLVQPEVERRMDLLPPAMKEVVLEHHSRCRPVAEWILAAMGDALGVGGGYFLDGSERMMVYQRFNRYPICERPDLVVGLKAHKDASAITLVVQDPEVVGGLQVVDAAGEWREVPVLPGALLVNVGDQIEIMSNGIYKSPMHRVVITATEKERVSVVSFYSMGKEKEIGPAGALVGEGRPRMYKNITVEEYLQAFYRNYPSGKAAIDTVKIQ